MAMNPEVKAKWVAALRSGEYRQGVKKLLRADKFCCLGVLTNLATEDGVCEWRVDPSSGIFGVREPGNIYTETVTLPEQVVTWAGMDDCNPEFEITPEVRESLRAKSLDQKLRDVITLTELNDNGFNFDEIADFIEQYA